MPTEEYWGYLIKEDKSPAPIFEQLLLGIASYINGQIAPWDTQCLTPAKLAAYYRLVGGDYNGLFLETPPPSLSFIYQSLGCYHTLQPDKDPYTPPTIPALTPQGFVRWQTVQLLLEPEEHVPLLQTAVKRFHISNPIDGNPFPNWLPRDALPSKPDPEMLQWHERVSDNLMIEVQKSQARRIPNMHTRALSDVASEGTLESSRDSHSRGSSDDQSLVNAGIHFPESRLRPFFKPPEPLNMPPGSRPPTQQRGAIREPIPWNPERRRSNSDPQYHRSQSSGWSHRDDTGRRNTVVRSATQPRPRPRSPSTVSTSSASSTTTGSDSSSDESDDHDHLRRRTSSTATLQPARRHSSHHLSSLPAAQSPRRPSPNNPSTFPPRPSPQQTPEASLPHRHPSAPGRANTRGLNVRWGADSVHNISPGRDRGRAGEGNSRAKSEERPRRSGGGEGERDDRGPIRGVGGRRYPTDGTAGWR